MKNNRTAYVILGMLSIAPKGSGYEIHKAIEENFGSFWGESYGQIYPTLKRLAAEGLIEACKPASAPKKRRQEYALTDAGRACLREWLALPFQNDPPRNEFLLKLFFGRRGSAGRRNRACPRTTTSATGGCSPRWKGSRRWRARINRRTRNKPYWMLTLGLGMAMTRAALDWGESALAELAAVEAAISPANLSS